MRTSEDDDNVHTHLSGWQAPSRPLGRILC